MLMITCVYVDTRVNTHMKIHHIPERRTYISLTWAEFVILILLAGWALGQIAWQILQN